SRADEGRGQARHGLRQTGPAGRRLRVQEGDRIVPRPGRVPALPGCQRLDIQSGKRLRSRSQLLPVSHPKTNKFVFLPGDLEFSLADFLLMGTAEQLMDLSLTHPYPGANKLVSRLLAITEVSEKYHKLLQELSEKTFTKEQLLKEIDAVENVTKEPLAKEK